MEKEVNQELERIFYAYYNILYKTAVIMLGNEHNAYDAVQETFVKFLSIKRNSRI